MFDKKLLDPKIYGKERRDLFLKHYFMCCISIAGPYKYKIAKVSGFSARTVRDKLAADKDLTDFFNECMKLDHDSLQYAKSNLKLSHSDLHRKRLAMMKNFGNERMSVKQVHKTLCSNHLIKTKKTSWFRDLEKSDPDAAQEIINGIKNLY
ncbi:MAG: hypothetical protein KAJ40_00590 [Alphaproteobacteria bacterium]|nr:hypothetical protein [Alphaproteobacteria bacterium]